MTQKVYKKSKKRATNLDWLSDGGPFRFLNDPHKRYSRQFWNETLTWATASGSPIASTLTETILFPNVTIPANYLQDGRCLRLRGFFAYGTTATPTLTFTLRWGGVAGTVLAKSAALTTTSAVGGGASMTSIGEFEILIQTRSNGSSGSLMTNGTIITHVAATLAAGTVANYGQAFAVASGSTGGTTPVAVTVDLTADTALSLTAVWGTSAAANSIQGLQYIIEALN